MKGLQFLVNQENCSSIHKVDICILRESMKISCIWDRKSPRGKGLAPQSKLLTGGPGASAPPMFSSAPTMFARKWVKSEVKSLLPRILMVLWASFPSLHPNQFPKVTALPTTRELRSSYTMRTKCAISDAFVRDCVFAYCASVAQYVYSLSAEHCFRLRNNAISDEPVRDCALSTHSVFRPLLTSRPDARASERWRSLPAR